jgi:hypothetical protein
MSPMATAVKMISKASYHSEEVSISLVGSRDLFKASSEPLVKFVQSHCRSTFLTKVRVRRKRPCREGLVRSGGSPALASASSQASSAFALAGRIVDVEVGRSAGAGICAGNDEVAIDACMEAAHLASVTRNSQVLHVKQTACRRRQAKRTAVEHTYSPARHPFSRTCTTLTLGPSYLPPTRRNSSSPHVGALRSHL